MVAAITGAHAVLLKHMHLRLSLHLAKAEALKAVHAGAADLDTAVTVLDNSADPDTVSSALKILAAKKKIRGVAELDDHVLDGFLYKLRYLGSMARYSFPHKAVIVPTFLMASLVIPESIMRDLWPAFIALGAHISIRDFKELVELARHTFTQHKMEHPKEAETVLKEGRRLDLYKTIEITASLLELMRGLPIESKVEIMTIYGFAMPALLFTAAAVLFACEHGGDALQIYGKQALTRRKDTKSFSRTPYRSDATFMIGLLGNAIAAGFLANKAAHAVFSVLPWAATGAGIYLGGRTIDHAAPTISTVTAQATNFIADTDNPIVTCCFTAMAMAACYRVAKSAYKSADKVPVLANWKKDAAEVFRRNKAPDSTLSKTANKLKDAVYKRSWLQKAHSFWEKNYV